MAGVAVLIADPRQSKEAPKDDNVAPREEVDKT